MGTFIVHYGELALKGRNRPKFEKRLVQNIHAAMHGLDGVQVERFHSYLVVESPESAPDEEVAQRLSHVFGIVYIAPALRVPPTMEAIAGAAVQLARESITPDVTFKVDARRGDKRFPQTSMDVARELGSQIVEETGAGVKLKDPDVTLVVQIYEESAYLFARRIPGPGGLPIGVSGRVLTLFSGGIDSPVAAHMLLKRGCTTDFLHFHVLPNQEQVHNSKVVAMVRKVLAPHGLPACLYMAPAHPFQLAVLELNSSLELVAFRRFVMRVAEKIAQRRKALALVTGDNLGQVASQTLQNLRVISDAVEMPILRPLVGFDKAEIIALAQQIDTYELSIQPYKDPCSLHASRPDTCARLDATRALEDRIGIEAVVEETIAQVEEIWID